MIILDRKLKFFSVIFSFFGFNAVAMENLKEIFWHIEFDYTVLHTSITNLFGDDNNELFALLDDISDDDKRKLAKQLVFARADNKTRGASLRILAAIRRWEETKR